MSITGLIDPEMNHNKKSFHRRNDSAELDVFEAERYFSGYNEANSYNSSSFRQKMMIEERHANRARVSLDMPMRSLLPQQFHGMEKQVVMKEKKQKEPSSPGGRLASFLNSLFSQSALKKKKKSKSSQSSMKDNEDDENPSGRRRRRSSISLFRSSSNADAKSIYSSLSSGFRTPPHHVQTPTKSCKEFRIFSDHKHAVSNGLVKPTTTLYNKLDPTLWDENYKHVSLSSEKQKNCGNNELAEKDMIWLDKYSAEDKCFKKFNVVDDGAESDSSSDLFELQNCDLGYCSSGLPVYETTNMDNIKRGAHISNGPM